MNNQIKQPQIRQCFHWLRSNEHFGMYAYNYDKRSRDLLDEFFRLLESISPVSENGVRSLWLTAERGSFTDFGDIDEMIDSGEFETKEEAEKEWEWMFPDEIAWYQLDAIEDKKEGYRAINLCHRCIIVQDRKRELLEYETEISELTEWLVDSVKNVIRMLRDNTYNDYVEKNLPPKHRTGTIRRKDFWDVWPQEREEFFKDISNGDVQEFIKLASSQTDDFSSFNEYLSSMTANDFFRCCALGYEAAHYEGCEKTPKEQYYLHADGRDEGLRDIDPDSPEGFRHWLKDRERYGGHPWEVCRGGNSTHIDLGVHYDDKGYFLFLAGKAWTRTVEIAHFYLALHRARIPVFLFEAKTLANRMEENELIGIVPVGVFPRYCESLFPDEHIISFMNLPYEDTDKFLPFCHWQTIEHISLVNRTNNESIEELFYAKDK